MVPGRMHAQPDAVDGEVRVIGEAKGVAVAGKATAQGGGKRQTVAPRTQQDLGAAKRARGEDDDIGPQCDLQFRVGFVRAGDVH